MNQNAIPEMLDWTRRAGYVPGDFAKRGLRCIHVAGTKGKGSVCSLAESILLQYRGGPVGGGFQGGERRYLSKIGTYTSPHLLTVRERIRIDGSPISESLFVRYFFEVWDRFSASTPDSDPMSLDTKPNYFRYLTILALHTFIQEGIETAIVECGIGGEYDSTNILPADAVTVSAIGRLGIDHIGMLGESISEIAWHKAGIMKTGVPAFTLKQVPAAQIVLQQRSSEKGVKLEVVKQLEPGNGAAPEIKLAMEGDYQFDNASLAVPVAAAHLCALGITNGVPEIGSLPLSLESMPEQFRRGLQSAKLQGRFEARECGNVEWLIDGAHTIDSIDAVGNWFIQRYKAAIQRDKAPTATMLIFNQQDRDAEALIRRLITTISGDTDSVQRMLSSDNSFDSIPVLKAWNPHASRVFTYAAFCANTPFKDEVGQPDLQRQERMASVYSRLDGNSLHMCYSSVEEAVELVSKVSEGDERLLVLATGSLYLVGGLLKVLEKQAKGKAV
jgi:folylpolyglutamate synthase